MGGGVMPFAKEMHKLGPAWMQRERGRLFWGAVGQVIDEQNANLKAATMARFPDYAPDDTALAAIGNDRQLLRGPSETAAAYKARLKKAFQAWLLAGTPAGILLQLKAQGFPMGTNGAHVVNHGGRWYRLNAGTDALEFGDTMACENRTTLLGTIPSPRLKGFTLDARDQFYSRFVILFPADYAPLRPNTETAARLNTIVAKWKPAKAHYDGCTVIASGGVWGWPLAKTWGSGTWGGSTVYMIPPAG